MMHLIAVFVENKPGQTAAITRILAAADVNICWVTIANTGSFGVMKFLVDKRDVAVAALKARNMMVSLLEIIAVQVPNQPGALQKIADLLAGRQINLANCSGFVANNRAIVIIELQEIAAAVSVLEESGLKLLNQEEMLNL